MAEDSAYILRERDDEMQFLVTIIFACLGDSLTFVLTYLMKVFHALDLNMKLNDRFVAEVLARFRTMEMTQPAS